MVFENKNVVDVDTVLDEVDSFGRYHVIQYALVLLPVLFTSMSTANYVFAAETTNYRCVVPECENGSSTIGLPPWWPNDVDHRCLRPTMNNISEDIHYSCTVNDFSGKSDKCDRWIYESDNSIVSEFDLACQEWKRALVGTVHNVGVLVSMPLLGYVSDRWGRRAAVICSAVGVSVGALKSLASGARGAAGGYNLYIVLELLEAAVGAAIYTSAFVMGRCLQKCWIVGDIGAMVVEVGGKKRRVMSTALLGFTIAFGEILISLLAYLVPYWRHFLLVIYCPTLIFITYILLLKESLRWLLINGKAKEAKKNILLVARMNGQTISDHVLTALDEGNVVCDKETDTPVEEFSLALLFSSVKLLKRLLICSWWWFSSAFIYYGLMINSVSLPGNKYVNFGLSAAVSVPGDLTAMLVLDKFGRKITLLLGFLFCGACCVANGFIPQSATGWGLAVFLLGKAAVSLCFNSVYVYTSELFPTSARTTLVGACSMFARIGSILAPLTPLLTSFWWSLPTLLFGCASLLAAALVLLTPETLSRRLPDTVAQAEGLDKRPHK